MFNPGLRPARHRGVYVGFTAAAGVALVSGAGYTAPASGAVIEAYNSTSAVAYAAVLTPAQLAPIAASLVVGGSSLREAFVWGPEYETTGQPFVGAFTFPGDYMVVTASQIGVPLQLQAGNTFLMFGQAANTALSGGFIAHEFLNPDEFERWTDFRGD